MTAIDRGDSRPPPVRERRLDIFTAGVPWYRDIKVLRVVAQIVFAIFIIGAVIFLISNLVTNLSASRLSLDFGIYTAPFNVAIPEGPSLTDEWGWLQDTNSIILSVILVWAALIALVGFIAVQQVRAGRLSLIYAVPAGVLYFLFVRFSPESIAQIVTSLGIATNAAQILGGVIWVSLLVGALVIFLIGYQYHKIDTRPAINIAVLLTFIAALTPPNEVGAQLAASMQQLFRGGTVARAFVTGISNTLVVVFFSLIGCTLLGIFVGIGLLSRNFLVRIVSQIYVEIFRNTPLLIQLLFIYRTLTLLLPAPRQSIFSPEWLGSNSVYILNARGFYFPALVPTESVNLFWGGLIGALVAFFALRAWRSRVQESTGQPAALLRYALLPALVIFVVGWLLSGTPFTIDYPVLDRLNVAGGTSLSIAFVSIFLGLTLYTAAFVADIVRAGIQAVPYGQIEAARAQGFSRAQVLNLIVLPQALRLIIPPLGNQYVNLGKNSSLAVAVTFVDVYRIAALANNESGQAVPFFAGLMLIYLVMSLTLSLLMNILNRTTRVKTR